MKSKACGSALVSALAILYSGSPAHADAPATETLALAMRAMGGREHLQALHTLELGLRVVTYRVDDSERADDPYWLNVSAGSEWRDEDEGRSRTEIEDVSAQWSTSGVRLDDGRHLVAGTMWLGRMRWRAAPSLGERLALSPERLLLTAAAATDLHALPDAVIFGKAQDVLAFTWKGFPTRLYVDKVMHLPVRLEMTRGSPFDQLSEMLGDVRWRTDFLFYRRQIDGLVYPFQWNVSRDGQPVSTTVVTHLDENGTPPSTGFTPPADSGLDLAAAPVPYADAPIAIPAGGDPLQPLGAKTWLVEGSWNVLVVRQPDGLVVIECPQSGGYSERIVALLAERFPGVPIKAVVSTTDSLWHYAGLRAYVAIGVPIYALDLNLPRLRTLIANPRSLVPDRLASHRRPALLRGVSEDLVIGRGATRIELHPVRGHGDERMLLAFMPGPGLLYGSSNDVGAGTEQPTFNAFEVVARADALGLPVRDYVAIHTAKMPWQRFKAIVSGNAVLSGS